jgi:hypothetical protein
LIIEGLASGVWLESKSEVWAEDHMQNEGPEAVTSNQAHAPEDRDDAKTNLYPIVQLIDGS